MLRQFAYLFNLLLHNKTGGQKAMLQQFARLFNFLLQQNRRPKGRLNYLSLSFNSRLI